MKVDRLDNGKRSTERSASSPADGIACCVRKLFTAELARKDGRPLPLYDAVIAFAEKPLIEVVLKHHDGNLSRAALTLGINRNTLRLKMLKHGILAGR